MYPNNCAGRPNILCPTPDTPSIHPFFLYNMTPGGVMITETVMTSWKHFGKAWLCLGKAGEQHACKMMHIHLLYVQICRIKGNVVIFLSGRDRWVEYLGHWRSIQCRLTNYKLENHVESSLTNVSHKLDELFLPINRNCPVGALSL